MKHLIKRTAWFLCGVMLLGTLSACEVGGMEAQSGSSQVQLPAASLTSTSNNVVSPREPAALDLTDATVITLTGSGASVEGKGATAEDSVVTITAAGVYAVNGTLEDGRIIVNAPKEDVTVALNGTDITCSYGSPLYIYKASTATVHLMEGTENTLTDGAAYTFADEYSSAEDEEPNACLYSKADLVIEGAGSLTVMANSNNGITSKDTLQIYDCKLAVAAVNHGINGKDSNTIDSASIAVICGGDAIRSTNDTDETLGWVSVSNTSLELVAGEDGIQAETVLTISSGSYTITSGGGSGVKPSDDVSTKGLKAGTTLNLTGGTYVLDCSDDAIHSNGDVTVSGGSYTISTGDDALHADEALTVSGGEIDILTSYEGLEGTTVAVSGGTIHVTSSDDGVNAAGGADGSGFGGGGRGNALKGGNSNSFINISGGYLVVMAGGDGLDSNGNAAMSGGTVIVYSTGRGDGALDYDGSFNLTGGTLLAAGSGGMSQTPSEASQYTISLGFDSTLPEGTYVSLKSNGQNFVLELPVSASSIVFSSPELKCGASYTVSYGGNYSGESVDGICSGGTYSGGTDLTALTLSNFITTYGSRGNMSGMGGRTDKNIGNEQRGGKNRLPAEGEVPEKFPNGELPQKGNMPGGRGDLNGAEKGADRTKPSTGSTPSLT